MSNLPFAPPPAGFDDDLLKQLATRHSALQQMWLSGYLYAVALHGQAASDGPPESSPAAAFPPTAGKLPAKVTVLYGSQTGNSRKVALQLAAGARERGWEVTLADLNDYPVKQLKEEKIVLLVVSTQGEGEPPVAAEEFYKWLHSARAPRLEGLRFAVCGLGDRSYLHFCQTGKDLDLRLEALGATRLAGRTDCDVDFEEAVEGWTAEVLAALRSDESRSSSARYAASSVESPAKTVAYDRKHPFPAAILEKIQLNGRGSPKETWHLELSLGGSGLRYEPGDSLGVYARNPPALVREVLYAAMLNGQKTVDFQGEECSLQDVLAQRAEITVLTREVVEKYAAWTSHTRLKALLEDPGALKDLLWGRNLADLLREFPAALSEQTLASFLRKLPPRLYSIASSLEAHPDEVHLTVAAVRYQYDGRPHQGAASTFLADRLAVGESVPVFIDRNEYFKLPADDGADIILVGPGTGVAPFRAFVEARSERGATGKNWLFFGNPHFETDFLYQTEWLNHLKRGSLDRLDVAFSRDQAEKHYVQHRLAERSKLIFDRLENGAYFYVCGDKERMAADVERAVVEIVARESGQGAEHAAEYVKGLKKQRRYLEDVY